MKITPLKLSIFPVLALICASVALIGLSCSTNPVKGWTCVWSSGWYMPDSPDKETYQKYKVVIDDYRNFIKKSQAENSIWFVGIISIYEDKTGKHAVKITVETGPRRYTDFYLMYDKSDKRSKTIKGTTAIQFHM